MPVSRNSRQAIMHYCVKTKYSYFKHPRDTIISLIYEEEFNCMRVKVLFLHIALQQAVTDKQQTEFTNN